MEMQKAFTFEQSQFLISLVLKSSLRLQRETIDGGPQFRHFPLAYNSRHRSRLTCGKFCPRTVQTLTLNSSAANFKTAVKGVPSGTLRTLKGSLGSLVSVILKVTLAPELAAITTLIKGLEYVIRRDEIVIGWGNHFLEKK